MIGRLYRPVAALNVVVVFRLRLRLDWGVVVYGPSNGSALASLRSNVDSSALRRTDKPAEGGVGMLCPDGPEGRSIPSSIRSSR